jgi:Rrf2 family protein
MRLNKSTGHAIRILIDCARADGRLVRVAELSEHLDITLQNVFKIVHLLSRAKLVAPTRGRNGGVALARPATEIRISDIVRAMESTLLEIEGSQSGATASAEADVNKVLDHALVAFISVLDQHTLADMARQPVTAPRSSPRPPPPTSARKSRAKSASASMTAATKTADVSVRKPR